MIAAMLLNPLHPTLIVAPNSVMKEWENELKNCIISRSKLRDIHFYHNSLGTTRISSEALASKGVVVTTLETMRHRYQSSALHGVEWSRIVIDEAQRIKNESTASFKAACNLRGGMRWALTGTPVENEIKDLHNLVKWCRLPHEKNFINVFGYCVPRASVKQPSDDREVLNFFKRTMRRSTKEFVAQGNSKNNLPTPHVQVERTHRAHPACSSEAPRWSQAKFT
jgi:SNF2 family DNA or RNA helicase